MEKIERLGMRSTCEINKDYTNFGIMLVSKLKLNFTVYNVPVNTLNIRHNVRYIK